MSVAEEELTERTRRRLWRRVALGGFSLGIVVASFAFFLPKVADYGDVWGVVVPNAAVLAGMAAVLLLLARVVTRKRLD